MLRKTEIYMAASHSNTINLLTTTIKYFAKFIRSKLNETPSNIQEYNQFLINLKKFEKTVLEEIQLAETNQHFITLDYINKLAIKLAQLKEIIERSDDSKFEAALKETLEFVRPSSFSLKNIGKKLICGAAGLAGAIVGSVIGMVLGGLFWGFMGATTLGVVGILLATSFPLSYLITVGVFAAFGGLALGFEEMVEGAKIAYSYAQEKLNMFEPGAFSNQYHSIDKIKKITMSLFQGDKGSNRYNTHLFFSNKKTPPSKLNINQKDQHLPDPDDFPEFLFK